jgi:hypothetical protein
MKSERRLHHLAVLSFWHGNDDSVPGVVSPGTPSAHVRVRGEDVDELAFAFVAPLGAEDDGYWGGGGCRL